MNRLLVLSLLVLAASTCAVAAEQPAGMPPGVTAPQPTVPEVFTLMGQFVRVAYNNEGYASLGYRIANESVGTEWMLIDIGVTLREGVKNQDVTRESFSVKVPDGSLVPLATQKEYGAAGYLRPLNQRADMSRDSLNYFPSKVMHASPLRFFGDPTKKGSMAFDKAELTDDRAWIGRLFFKIPGGIKTGQHWLVIKFAGSQIEVPFRILTKDEAKILEDNWKTFKKELEAGFKQ